MGKTKGVKNTRRMIAYGVTGVLTLAIMISTALTNTGMKLEYLPASTLLLAQEQNMLQGNMAQPEGRSQADQGNWQNGSNMNNQGGMQGGGWQGGSGDMQNNQNQGGGWQGGSSDMRNNQNQGGGWQGGSGDMRNNQNQGGGWQGGSGDMRNNQNQGGGWQGGSGDMRNNKEDNWQNEGNMNGEGEWHGSPEDTQSGQPENMQTDQQDGQLDTRWQQDMLREWEKNRPRELQQVKKMAKQNPNLQSGVTELESLLQQGIGCVKSASTQEELQSCQENFGEQINEGFEKIHFAEQMGNFSRELEEFTKVEKRELPRMEKEGMDVSTLKTKLAAIKDLITKMSGATDQSELEDYRFELDDLRQDFWDSMRQVQEMQQYAQFNQQCDKDVAREVKRATKELQREGGDTSLVNQLEGLVKTCKAIVADAMANAQASEPVDGWELGERMKTEVWEKFEEIMRSMHEGRLCKDIGRGITEMEKGVTEEAPQFIQRAPKSVQPKLTALLEKGKKIATEAKRALEANECEEAADIMRAGEDLQWEFQAVMESVGMDEEDLVDYEDNYDEFSSEFDDEDLDVEIDKEKVKQYLKKQKAGLGEMDMMKKIAKDILAEYLSQNEGKDDFFVKQAQRSGLGTSEVQELMKAKSELQQQIAALREQASQLREQLSQMKNEILAQAADYTPDTKVKNEFKTFTEELSGLSDTEAKSRFEELMKKSREAKFEKGFIPFKDIDDGLKDQQWIVEAAQDAKDSGLLKGNPDGTLNPGGTLNVSEAFVAITRIFGIDDSATSSSTVANRVAPWAKAAVATLEQKGVDVSFAAKLNAGSPIQRKDVAVLLNAALGLENADIDQYSFPDTKGIPETQAIANLNAAGIMTGNSDGTFGPNTNLNRAALAAILARAGR